MNLSKTERAKRIPWGSIRAILLDWAGTTIDYGSLAPVEVVRAVFQHYGIAVTESEAREPMGQAKIDHIKAVLAMPRIASQWRSQTSAEPTDQDVQKIYKDFLLLQKEVLARYSDPIPGVPEAIAFFRSMNCKIGSTTGYTRELMEVVIPIAARGGYQPDVTICSDEVASGRPAPWSNFHAAEKLGVYPMSQIVIVDDSIAGIQAGKNAGCFSVAVSKTGNALGLPLEGVNRLEVDQLADRLLQIDRVFYESGADLVVESVEELAKLWVVS
ncbi:MAG: phosphonoacetaldehyde hydrolase [Planctomycetes bacterium]|nr:phosphonoacetaldehyde hydrolase [Planctomycetota bacterium]